MSEKKGLLFRIEDETISKGVAMRTSHDGRIPTRQELIDTVITPALDAMQESGCKLFTEDVMTVGEWEAAP